MKKYFLTTLVLTLSFAIMQAQVTLQPNIPPVGIIQKSQLWNVLVVNSSTTTYPDCRLRLLLRDRITGQEILTATTGIFSIEAGAKQLNTNVLNPIQYNYLTGSSNISLQSLILAGSYTACYSLSSKYIDVVEDCVPFDAEPLSPPMLIFPSDSSVLDVAPTQFSWTAPTPANMFDRLHYEVVITEIQEGQKADEAIQQNLPFYIEENVLSNSLSYPSSAPSFLKNKWYAWQVIARDDKAYAGKSEAWVFIINSKKEDQKINSDSYILVKNNTEETGISYIKNNTLLIKYYNYEKEQTKEIKLLDANNKIIQIEKVLLKYGENFLSFVLSNRFKPNLIYKILLPFDNNTHSTTLFSIYK